MFIFINKDIIIKENNIIGIFNIETKENKIGLLDFSYTWPAIKSQ